MNILKSLRGHNHKEKASFHMPGHKSGEIFKGTEFESELWELDTTELSDTDCLINPEDCIKRAEEKASEVYGAKKSFFLVNGATCGILAMFYAAFREGERVIVCRDCHRSVINAMVLSGVVPIYVEPKINEKGFSCGADTDAIKKVLKNNPDVRGVFITSPTYFGVVSDIAEIAKIAHEKDALVLCDEAHGAHFPFSDKFPKSAVSCGADMSVVSLHKSLPCPNQTAILNLGNCRVSQQEMKNAVNMFQTTSPSYIFMSTMEYALELGAEQGEKLTEEVLNNKTESRFIYSFDDPLKLILDFSPNGYTGYEVLEILERDFGIFAELATMNCVLLMASWGNTHKDFMLLEEAINYISSLPQKKPLKINENRAVESKCLKTPKAVYYAEKEKVLINDSVGRTAAREVTIFPPCIPVFMPGEEIKREHIEIINNAKDLNLTITGIDDSYILVTKDLS